MISSRFFSMFFDVSKVSPPDFVVVVIIELVPMVEGSAEAWIAWRLIIDLRPEVGVG